MDFGGRGSLGFLGGGGVCVFLGGPTTRLVNLGSLVPNGKQQIGAGRWREFAQGGTTVGFGMGWRDLGVPRPGPRPSDT